MWTTSRLLAEPTGGVAYWTRSQDQHGWKSLHLRQTCQQGLSDITVAYLAERLSKRSQNAILLRILFSSRYPNCTYGLRWRHLRQASICSWVSLFFVKHTAVNLVTKNEPRSRRLRRQVRHSSLQHTSSSRHKHLLIAKRAWICWAKPALSQ